MIFSLYVVNLAYYNVNWVTHANSELSPDFKGRSICLWSTYKS